MHSRQISSNFRVVFHFSVKMFNTTRKVSTNVRTLSRAIACSYDCILRVQLRTRVQLPTIGVGATFEIIITGGKKRERERERERSEKVAVRCSG